MGYGCRWVHYPTLFYSMLKAGEDDDDLILWDLPSYAIEQLYRLVSLAVSGSRA